MSTDAVHVEIDAHCFPIRCARFEGACHDVVFCDFFMCTSCFVFSCFIYVKRCDQAHGLVLVSKPTWFGAVGPTQVQIAPIMPNAGSRPEFVETTSAFPCKVPERPGDVQLHIFRSSMAKSRKTTQLDVMSDVIKFLRTWRVDVGTSPSVWPGEQCVGTHMTAIVKANRRSSDVPTDCLVTSLADIWAPVSSAS